MHQSVIKILNEEGLHARPAGVLASTSAKFKSQIEIVFKDSSKNAKSIMALMSLGLKKDDEVVVRANGEDETDAVNAICALANNKFSL